MLVQRVVEPGEGIAGPAPGVPALGAAVAPYADRAPMPLYRGRTGTPFTNAIVPWGPVHALRRDPPDVTHLHWVGDGFVSVEEVGRLPGRVVWTLHDQWAFTGGCHYAGDCRGFERRCGGCPQLGSRHSRDLSRLHHARKRRAWSAQPITVVCPSRWMAAEARASLLFGGVRIETIPYGLDLDVFRPRERAAARAALGQDHDGPLILCGAASLDDERKGFAQLLEAFGRIGTPGVKVLAFGAASAASRPLPVPVTFLGALGDAAALRDAYAAADVFVVPSLEDNLPLTVQEALACGTPVAAFDVGGLPDMVEPGRTGALAAQGDAGALATAIDAVLSVPDPMALAARCRGFAEERFSLALQAERHAELYADLCGTRIRDAA